MGHPRFSNEEIGRRGMDLYEKSVRTEVETAENIGKIVSIDIETGDYAVGRNSLEATDVLLARHPGAALFGMRIGYDVVYSFDDVLEPTKR